MRTLNSPFKLPTRNVSIEMTAEMGMDEATALGPNTSIITHTKTHVMPEQKAQEKVSQLDINIESKETLEENQ